MIATEYGYNSLCTDKLKGLFSIGIHTDPKSVDIAFKECRDILITEFASECKKITTTYSMYSLLQSYSYIAAKGKSSNCDIVAKSCLRNIILETVKNKLCESHDNKINKALREKLFFLTKSLNKLSQDQYNFYLNDNKGFQLELYENCCAFTLYDEQLCEKLNAIASQFTPDYFKGTILNNNLLLAFKESTISAFGDVASELYDTLFNQIPPDRIVDLTELFTKYTENPFLKGLLLRKENVSLLESYTHPHKANRPRFRPILELNIEDTTRYITTPYLVFEAIDEHVLNQLPFGLLPKEWKSNNEISSLAKKWKEDHDKWLDDKVQLVLEKHKLIFARNRKSVDGINLDKEPSSIEGRNVGEIDFIIVDKQKHKVSVIDTKFIKTKYHMASFGDDKSKFTKGPKPYEEQLFIKSEWVSNNLDRVWCELNLKGEETEKYSIDLYFITNAPSYYNFFSKYPIIPVANLERHIIDSI